MAERLRVVIAEDGLIVREGIAGMLRHFGHDVVAAVGDADAPSCSTRAARPVSATCSRTGSAR
jgi:hypothetical protein